MKLLYAVILIALAILVDTLVELNTAPPPAQLDYNTALRGGETFLAAPIAVAPRAAKTGKQIYNETCAGCHATGAAGAPRKGRASQWVDRLTKGTSALYLNAINGVNAMPPRGTCFDCTDQEIHDAVDYLVGE